jgi:hypothetical protein
MHIDRIQAEIGQIMKIEEFSSSAKEGVVENIGQLYDQEVRKARKIRKTDTAELVRKGAA